MYRPIEYKKFSYPKGGGVFGGSHAVGKRKNARPIAVKESMHIIFRSERARGKLSLLLPQNARIIYQLMKTFSARFDVRVYHFAFVGNHAHFIVKAKTKKGFQSFLRAFPGQVAQRLTKARPGSPLSKRFWDFIAFSRIVKWGRAFTFVKNYVSKNILEGAAIRVSWLTNTS